MYMPVQTNAFMCAVLEKMLELEKNAKNTKGEVK